MSVRLEVDTTEGRLNLLAEVPLNGDPYTFTDGRIITLSNGQPLIPQ